MEVPVEARHATALDRKAIEFQGDTLTFDMGPIFLHCSGIHFPLEITEITKDAVTGEVFMGVNCEFTKHRIVGNSKKVIQFPGVTPPTLKVVAEPTAPTQEENTHE